jgi:hypothetical protein
MKNELKRIARFGAGYVVCGFLLAACGSGGNSEPETLPVSAAPDLNKPPVIYGTPPVSVPQSASYAFSPSASDPDGDPLSFSILNRPPWANFDSANGSLSGTPGSADTGTTTGIVISVSDGAASASLPPFDLTVTAGDSAGPIIISATAPTNYVWAVLADNEPVYVDGAGKFINVPAVYRGLQYLRTGDNDKFFAIADAISFTVDQPVSVLIAYDPQFSAVPVWLESWANTGTQLTASHLVFDVYLKDFPAGRVILGGNEFGGNMYSVIVAAAGQLVFPTLPPEQPPIPPPAPPPNVPPTISGVPGTSINAGSNYQFQPVASDADGDVLTFSITNLPSWANFDSGSGAFLGLPTAADVGTYPNIVIGVSDGQTSVSLNPFNIDVVGGGLTGSATLSWIGPTQNADGTPLTDLAGFSVYYGTTLGSYPYSDRIDNPGVTTHVIRNLASGTWFFVVTARDTAGNQSVESNAASKTILP